MRASRLRSECESIRPAADSGRQRGCNLTPRGRGSTLRFSRGGGTQRAPALRLDKLFKSPCSGNRSTFSLSLLQFCSVPLLCFQNGYSTSVACASSSSGITAKLQIENNVFTFFSFAFSRHVYPQSFTN